MAMSVANQEAIGVVSDGRFVGTLTTRSRVGPSPGDQADEHITFHVSVAHDLPSSRTGSVDGG